MEIQTVWMLFIFNLVLFILFQIRSMRRETVPAMFLGVFSAMCLFWLGITFIAPICYIGWLSNTVDDFCPTPYEMQQPIGYTFLILSFCVLIQVIFVGLFGHKDLPGGAFETYAKGGG